MKLCIPFVKETVKRLRSLFSGVCIIHYLFPIIVYAGQTIPLPDITSDEIIINGRTDETAWNSSLSFKEFRTSAPDFGLQPSEKTVVWITYDRHRLFVAFRCYDREASLIRRTLTKRDNLGNDDWVGVEIDATNSAQMGYLFRVNPYGIQEDGIINQDMQNDLTYDAVWSSAATQDDEGYTVEMAIPFSSLRLAGVDSVRIGVSFSRSISRRSELLVYPEYHPEIGSTHLQRQTVTLSGLKHDRVIEFIPGFTTTQKQNRSAGSWQRRDGQYNFSLDHKFGLTPDLMLDLTYNPDFSHIESDAGAIDANLRNSIYYPEKRPFFIEGQELFNLSTHTYLYTDDLKKIFHSRNIVDPVFGAKISGKVGSRNSVSTLIAIDGYPKTAAKESGTGTETNAYYGVFRYRRSLAEDGYAGMFYSGKDYGRSYNHVSGIDGRYRLSGTSKFEYQMFGSATRPVEGGQAYNGYAYAFKYSYSTRVWNIHAGYRDVSADFITESGYLQRSGIRSLPATVYYSVYRDSSVLQKINFLWNGTYSIDRFSDKVERSHNWFGMELYFPRKTWTWFGVNLRDVVYREKRFDRKTAAMGIYSQVLKRLYVAGEMWIQKEAYYDDDHPFQGEEFGTYVNFTIQPSDNISHETEFSYSTFRRASDHENIFDYKIIREKLTYQFNKHFFIRGIAEYNSYRRKITFDFLMSYTYAPGTVIYLGYGSMLEKQDAHDRYRPLNRVGFLKATYLMKI